MAPSSSLFPIACIYVFGSFNLLFVFSTCSNHTFSKLSDVANYDASLLHLIAAIVSFSSGVPVSRITTSPSLHYIDAKQCKVAHNYILIYRLTGFDDYACNYNYVLVAKGGNKMCCQDQHLLIR